MKEKHAVLSMDIEDWYHLDYFANNACDRSYSMLDGLNSYQQLLESHRIYSSYFVLGELVQPMKRILRQISDQGSDIGIHGWSHVRPLTMDVGAFEAEVRSSKHELEDILGRPVIGYRAPCFSLDRERLDVLQKVGITFDSSRILFGDHPLYGEIDMNGFEEYSSGIYRRGDFIEFEISTLLFAGKQIPVSGGGYLRIFPWIIMERLLKRYLEKHDFYVLYVHPFETSSKPNPVVPQGISRSSQFRFSLGRATVFRKLDALIKMLKEYGFKFITFSELRDKILKEIDNSIK